MTFLTQLQSLLRSGVDVDVALRNSATQNFLIIDTANYSIIDSGGAPILPVSLICKSILILLLHERLLPTGLNM